MGSRDVEDAGSGVLDVCRVCRVCSAHDYKIEIYILSHTHTLAPEEQYRVFLAFKGNNLNVGLKHAFIRSRLKIHK